MSTNTNQSILDAYSSLKREMGLLFTQDLKAYKFGRNQMLVVFHLQRLGLLSASDLCELTLSDKAAMSRTLCSLEKLGWVRRSSDSKDQRKISVELTALGKRHAKDVGKLRADFAETLDGAVTAKERDELIRLFHKLIVAIKKKRGVPVDDN